MALQESERPGVTEMHVRMDCNGCVNRIKKALHSVDGVYEVQVSFPEQKVTVIGRAAPEKMLRAIKKTRKTATICSHTEPGAPEQAAPPADPSPAAGDPPADAPPAEAPAAAPPAPEQSTQEPPTAPQEDAAAGEAKPSPEAAPAATAAAAANQAAPEDPPAEAKDVGEIHTTHDHCRPHRGVYRDHWGDDRAHGGYGSGGQHEAPYLSSTVIHSYSRHRPATYVSEYGYLQPPPHSARYAVVEPYGEVDYHRSGRGSDGNNNITSMFSDENPNACTIV